MPIIAIILISLFRGAVERGFDARLDAYLTNLLAGAIDAETGKLLPSPDIGSPQFERPLDGWYWQVTPVVDGRTGTDPALASNSLLAEVLKLPSHIAAEQDDLGLRKATITGPKNQRLRLLEREVRVGPEDNQVRYSFAVGVVGDDVEEEIQSFKFMRKALLVFHAPRDETVGIDNAADIFQAAKHPKSFISLDNADHLLSRREDAAYVAEVLTAWASRFIASSGNDGRLPFPGPDGEVSSANTGEGKFQQEVVSGGHRFLADEPVSYGGFDSGPSPYDFLSTALATCTSMKPSIALSSDDSTRTSDRVIANFHSISTACVRS